MNDTLMSAEQLTDLAMVAAIMGNEVFDKAYDSNVGYIETANNIAKWALDFQHKYGRINSEGWEDILSNPTKHGFPKEVMCWDDAIMWFANKKCEEWLSQQ